MKHIMKIAHSIIHPSSIQEVFVEYDLAPIEDCKLLSRHTHDTYKITTKEDCYIFRIYRQDYRDEASILFELEAILHLQQAGLPVSYPIPKKDGSYICEIQVPEGVRYGVLFSFAEGIRPPVNEENAWLIGDTLGYLHNASQTFESNYQRAFQIDTDYLLDQPCASLAPVIERYLGESAVQVMNERVDELKTTLDGKSLEVGFCHGNFYPHHMHKHENKLEVFGFNHCAIGYRLYDVAVAWWNLHANYQADEKPSYEAFLNGYLAQRPLSDDALKTIPLLITTRRVWLLGTMVEEEMIRGTNWMSKNVFELFLLHLKGDRIRD
ncbi:phosphotransferase [Oceanobacillus halotolerans]|uniref:phosphotransferase n=1 Tax=Oceanobacillus halotolerans TaxID=2663380 RepID=UPI0013D98AA9|nr:phosphotransferase [Oceanobacillus halotolerans]